MGSFGENLRRERELRGITLVELSNATRINRKYLVALEDDQFHQLPGGVFNRGFVRAIAGYMKLDEHHWIGEYARAAGEEAEVLARYSPPRPPAPSSISRRVWSLVVLVALFGAAAYLVHQVRMQRAAEAAARTTTGQPPTISPPPASAAPATTTRTAPREQSPAATELRLQIDTLKDAQVTVTVDGQPAFQGRMGPGETRTFRAGREIELSTNNAAAVVLTLNGKTLAPLGNPGETKQVTLTAKDLL
ncbi:MAG: helix-turn-helix domain-containing protein [Candidatus Acidiferrales bacterium]